MGRLVETGSKYTDERRWEVVALYLVKGSVNAVSRETGVPPSTICSWKKSDWWHDVSNQIAAETEEKRRSGFSLIVEKSIDGVLDRIENGDEVHTKDGIKRIKMGGKELMITGATAYDKLRISVGLPTSITENGVGSRKQLQDLAEQFRQISEQNRTIQGECREVVEEGG